ncbi:MAG: hypothetical protein EB078_04990 [Proteobacteria bacterium]|nr:hypothetical protein [Pseudomonadota bacterium]NDC24229.1 hypothetical protein [Pseudomonadota bacterium]NDD04240.1 hypothetical protein [Pseudomonadota bacterium]NDG25666.1 hypothetical protein [Pseudomonadota bacterium]
MTTAERKLKEVGKSSGCADHDHDLVHELSKRLDAFWRIDQYISNAKGHPKIESFWRRIKSQEESSIEQLKELISDEVKQGCF